MRARRILFFEFYFVSVHTNKLSTWGLFFDYSLKWHTYEKKLTWHLSKIKEVVAVKDLIQT